MWNSARTAFACFCLSTCMFESFLTRSIYVLPPLAINRPISSRHVRFGELPQVRDSVGLPVSARARTHTHTHTCKRFQIRLYVSPLQIPRFPFLQLYAVDQRRLRVLFCAAEVYCLLSRHLPTDCILCRPIAHTPGREGILSTSPHKRSSALDAHTQISTHVHV